MEVQQNMLYDEDSVCVQFVINQISEFFSFFYFYIMVARFKNISNATEYNLFLCLNSPKKTFVIFIFLFFY